LVSQSYVKLERLTSGPYLVRSTLPFGGKYIYGHVGTIPSVTTILIYAVEMEDILYGRWDSVASEVA